jgi:hypothetical protein
MDISTATIDRAGYKRKCYKYPGNAGESASIFVKFGSIDAVFVRPSTGSATLYVFFNALFFRVWFLASHPAPLREDQEVYFVSPLCFVFFCLCFCTRRFRSFQNTLQVSGTLKSALHDTAVDLELDQHNISVLQVFVWLCWTFGFHKMLVGSWGAAQLTAPQEGLSSVSK